MNKKDLAKKIWEASDNLRGKIDANAYKDFILGFIFYKFVSDKEVEFLRKKHWNDNAISTDLNESTPRVVESCQENLGYFISYENLFGTWVSSTTFSVANVTGALNAFNRLIGKKYKKVFDNIFNSLQQGINILGDSDTNKTKTVKKLIRIVKNIPMDEEHDYDALGYIYEYLIKNFAANAKKAGEFYTPHEVALVMADIVAFHHRDKQQLSIYDPTSGSASLLLNIGKAVQRHSNQENNVRYFAQELKPATYDLTRMNLVMRGILPGNILTRNADTLGEDWPFIDENNKNTPLYVDAVVSNPPYSQDWIPTDHQNDPRFSGYGLAPKGKADLAFLLHNLYHIKDDGIVTIIMPHGVLFRGGEEYDIRRQLIEKNNIDAIIGLPPNCFYGTSIPTLIMILRKNKTTSDILFIDASKGFVKDGTKNKLRARDMKQITDTYKERSCKAFYSRIVSRDEIKANDYNLNISRYISSNEKSESYDIYSTIFGGIPPKEVEELSDYWDVFPSLKENLFEIKKDGYYSLLHVNLSTSAIINNNDVKEFLNKYKSHFSTFDAWLNERLITNTKSVDINKEESIISNELFERLEGIPLIDKYDVYQHLDDQWKKIENDIELIKNDGWDAARAVDPNMVTVLNNDEYEEQQKGWKGRIFPFTFIQETLLTDEFSFLNEQKEKLQGIDDELLSLIDMLDEDGKQKILNDENNAFVSQQLEKTLNEIYARREPTPEIKLLNTYLSLTKKRDKEEFIKKHIEEVDWSKMTPNRDGIYTATVTRNRIKSIYSTMEFGKGTFEYIVSTAKKLIQEEKQINKSIKETSKTLEESTINTIKNLSDENVCTLLYEKWITPFISLINDMPNRVIKDMCNKLNDLGKKYETTFTDIENQIKSTSSELTSMIDNLIGNDFDMTGLKEFQKILED